MEASRFCLRLSGHPYCSHRPTRDSLINDDKAKSPARAGLFTPLVAAKWRGHCRSPSRPVLREPKHAGHVACTMHPPGPLHCSMSSFSRRSPQKPLPGPGPSGSRPDGRECSRRPEHLKVPLCKEGEPPTGSQARFPRTVDQVHRRIGRPSLNQSCRCAGSRHFVEVVNLYKLPGLAASQQSKHGPEPMHEVWAPAESPVVAYSDFDIAGTTC